MAKRKQKPPTYGEVVTALGAALDLIEYLRGPRLVTVPVATNFKRIEKIWNRAFVPNPDIEIVRSE